MLNFQVFLLTLHINAPTAPQGVKNCMSRTSCVKLEDILEK